MHSKSCLTQHKCIGMCILHRKAQTHIYIFNEVEGDISAEKVCSLIFPALKLSTKITFLKFRSIL